MIIKVKENSDYPSCPLRSDLNSCKAVSMSEINYCPTYSENQDGLYSYKLPENCPLRSESIIIQLETI